MNIEICKKGNLDLDVVLPLIRMADGNFTPRISESVDLEAYSKKLSKYANFLIAKDSDGYHAGFIAYYLNDETKQIYITLIVVDGTYQHYGIGSKMIQLLIEEESKGYRSIALEVRKSNKSARLFYKKHGFLAQEDRGNKILLYRIL